MIMYGFTVSCNDNNPESYVSLNPSKEKAVEEAIKEIKEYWTGYDCFEDGMDKNDYTLEDHISDLQNEGITCLQGPDFHVEINLFAIDMGKNIINLDDYIASVLWSKDDIKEELIDNGFEGTDAQVDEVLNSSSIKHLNDCDDRDWQIISDAIWEAARKNPDTFKQKETEEEMEER